MALIQLRRGTAAQWTSANPVLEGGEFGVETDTLKIKVGDGVNVWTGLPYVGAEYDEVVEAATSAGFPATGASGVLYVALDTNLLYRWGVSTYVTVGDSTGGVAVATLNGVETLTNKTLTGPKINTIYDANGNPILNTSVVPAAVNFLAVQNHTTGNSPALLASGSDTDVSLNLAPQGDGSVVIYVSGTTATVQADGTSTDIDLDLVSKGSGKVLLNGVEADSASGATRNLMTRLTRNVSDATWLVVGDSTGNETTEWVYLTAQWLASRFPAYTVNYYLWDTVGDAAYASAVTVQTGTGTHVLSVYNASVAGTTTGYFQGTRFTAAIAGKNADLLTVSHGHNQGGPVDTENLIQYQRNQYLAFVDEAAVANPNAGVLLILQNPSAVSGRELWQQQRALEYARAASWRGWGVVDVCQAFTDYGNWAADLTNVDGLHPNSAGEALWASLVTAALERATKVSVTTQSPMPMRPPRQLFSNPLLSAWLGALPDGVSSLTLCTVAPELSDYETGTQAMTITATSSSGWAYAEMTGTADAWGIKGRLASRTYTAAVRLKVAAANTATARVTLLDNNGGAQGVSTDLGATTRDRYVWMYVTKNFPANATTLTLRISPRTSGTSTVACTVDEILIFPGEVPHTGGDQYVPLVASATHAATSKTTPVDADEVPLADSESSFSLKRLTWANLKAAIASYIASAAMTMTNKTLTAAKLVNNGYLADANSQVLFAGFTVASSVNFLGVSNAATTTGPRLSATGADTNVDLVLVPKGTGAVGVLAATGQTPKVQALGADSNHNLNLISKGTGVVQANGSPVVFNGGTAPSIAVHADAGTGAVASVVAGNRLALAVSVTTGTAPVSGTLATLTYSAFTAAPYVAATPTSAPSAALLPFVNKTTTTVVLKIAGTPVANTTYTFDLVVIG